MARLNIKSCTLQKTVDKAITSYNQALSKNNTLKNEINELRKDKKNNNEIFKTLQDKGDNLKQEIKIKREEIQLKQQNIDEVKDRIMEIKEENEGETK